MLDFNDDPGVCQDDDMGPLLEPLLLNATICAIFMFSGSYSAYVACDPGLWQGYELVQWAIRSDCRLPFDISMPVNTYQQVFGGEALCWSLLKLY